MRKYLFKMYPHISYTISYRDDFILENIIVNKISVPINSQYNTHKYSFYEYIHIEFIHSKISPIAIDSTMEHYKINLHFQAATIAFAAVHRRAARRFLASSPI